MHALINMNIFVFGDSITQGFFDTENGGWCSQLSNYVMKKVVESNFELEGMVFNLGVSGDTTKKLLDRFSLEIGVRCSIAA